MEGVATKALKTSFWPELNHEPVSEDISWVENVIPGDDFSVDDLLDFSKDEVFNVQQEEEEKDFVSVSSHEEDTHNDNETEISNGVSLKDDFSELSVPADDVEQLEWLSNFVEESFSEQHSVYPILVKTETLDEELTKKPENLTPPLPGKARSKRSRTGGRVWSLGYGSSGETTTTTSASSCSSISSGSSASTSCLIFSNATPNLDYFYNMNNLNFNLKKPGKKQRKKRKSDEAGGYGYDEGAQMQHFQRRCSHCGVQKTPQWRAGPNGAKTLCNACGVRYKSGRLLPEYRPACSPSFSREVHSNSHRKVMEMRKKKQIGGVVGACDVIVGYNVHSPVQSF